MEAKRKLLTCHMICFLIQYVFYSILGTTDAGIAPRTLPTVIDHAQDDALERATAGEDIDESKLQKTFRAKKTNLSSVKQDFCEVARACILPAMRDYRSKQMNRELTFGE